MGSQMSRRGALATLLGERGSPALPRVAARQAECLRHETVQYCTAVARPFDSPRSHTNTGACGAGAGHGS